MSKDKWCPENDPSYQAEVAAFKKHVQQAYSAPSEVARLTAEVEVFTKCGIAEIAARNPSVMEYMRHWEGRAEAAEAEVARLRSAMMPFAKAGALFAGTPTDPRWEMVLYNPAAGPDYQITEHHVRAAFDAMKLEATK